MLTYIHQMNRVNSQNDVSYDDSTINIVLGIIIIIIIITDTVVCMCSENEACLIAKRSDYRRSTLGFKSYTVTVNISDNSVPQQWAVQQFTLVVESTNDNPPQPGSKTVIVNTYNGLFDNVPVGGVYVNDTDDWDLKYLTFSFADSPANSYFT